MILPVCWVPWSELSFHYGVSCAEVWGPTVVEGKGEGEEERNEREYIFLLVLRL